MSCASCLAGCLLVLINVIFLILSIAFVAVGGILKWGGSVFAGYVQPILDGLLRNLSSGQQPPDVEVFLNDLLGFLSGISTGLLVVGIFLFALSICGMCGACCKTKYLLLPYIVVTSVIFAAFLGLLIWFAVSRDSLEVTITASLSEWIRTQYRGVGQVNFGSLFWDFLNMMFECCGVTNGTDFVTATGWNRVFSHSISGHSYNLTLTYPLSCCKMNNFRPVDINCTWDPTDANSNHGTGCWSKVQGLYTETTAYALGGLGGVCGLLALLVVLAVCVFLSINKSSVQPAKS